jgi:iron(III) transport system ATP-binding protein
MIRIENLAAVYGDGTASVTALNGVSLDVARGEVFVLLGPSGCGKTTLLRCLAGLERPRAGRILLDGMCVADAGANLFVPPHQRPMAMVFQSYAMWPHMSVFENVAFPLRAGAHRIPAAEVEGRVNEVLGLLEIAHLKDRAVTALSGGQQQRVGLARALALRPKVLLMDEPLSNLDHRLQVQVRGQLRALLRQLGQTVVHVTHNQEEALELGDRIAVLNYGRVVQVADGSALYTAPADTFVAGFLGGLVLVPGSVREIGNGMVTVSTGLGSLRARAGAAARLGTGAACAVGFNPADVQLDATGAGDFVVTVMQRRPRGLGTVYELAAGDVHMTVSRSGPAAWQPGDRLQARIGPDQAVAIPPASTGADA